MRMMKAKCRVLQAFALLCVAVGLVGCGEQGKASPLYSDFAGSWARTTGRLFVSDTGVVVFNNRAYVTCKGARLGECDTWVGHRVYGGHLVYGLLARRQGKTAYGNVEGSTQPTLPGQPIELNAPGDGSIVAVIGNRSLSFCAPLDHSAQCQ